MHPLAKILIGILIMLGSVYYVLRGFQLKPYIELPPALPDVLTVLNGAIPPFVFLIGLFIVWLEYDEWKIERELAKEEKKRRRKK